ncbi:polysaccharide deacetylase family protein [Thalassospira alkalitolerans]|uniref:polysaccharide deacetylase family protein n=1 Tax=Thalassospira alkalitolerans TaxID=1293890 RepID=UPI003AA7CBD4
MKVIMYHYVRRYNPSLPHFRFLDVENFKKQLDYFAENFGFVSQSEWATWVTTGQMPHQPDKIILTFDDAMSCHYDYVYPELLKRNLWGIFYACSQPYLTGKMLDVHRTHVLCGAFEGRTLVAASEEVVSPDMIPNREREEFTSQTYRNQENYSGVSRFKRMLNYFVDPALKTHILDKIFEHLDYQVDSKGFYVSQENLIEMNNNGMIIGSHSVTHTLLSTLSLDQQRYELEESFRFIESITAQRDRTYCHPYGGTRSYNKDTLSILEQLNTDYAFSVNYRDIDDTDFVSSRQTLPRYDCNLFPHGLAS